MSIANLSRTWLSGAAIATLLTVSSASNAAPDQEQLGALSDIYASLNGAAWSNNSGWNTASDACTWYGITCDASGTLITKLDLQKNNLQGKIPESIAKLQALEGLILDSAKLGGTRIPETIGQLSNLRELYLNDAGLQGPIPAALGNLTELRSLVLDDNRLSGEIPAALGSLTKLRDLRLYRNILTGEIPRELGSLQNLLNLSISSNRLVGIIPSELVNLTELATISLDWNALHSDDGTLNTFINQRLSQSASDNYIDTQTIDASTAREPELGATQVTLHWDQRNTTPATEGGYHVYLASGAEGPYSLVKTVEGKTTDSTVLTDLTAGTTYFVKVLSFTSSHEENTQPEVLVSSGLYYDPGTFTTLAETEDGDSETDKISTGGGGGALLWLPLTLLAAILRRRALNR